MVVRLHLYASFGVLWHLSFWLGFCLLLRHQHHLRHVHLLVQDLCRSTESPVRLDVVGRKGVVNLTLVAAQSAVWRVRALVIQVSSSGVSARRAPRRHEVVPFAALTELVLEFQRDVACRKALQMNVRNRFQGCPIRMVLLRASTCKSRVGLLSRRLIAIAKETHSKLLSVVSGRLSPLRWLVYCQLNVTLQ